MKHMTVRSTCALSLALAVAACSGGTGGDDAQNNSAALDTNISTTNSVTADPTVDMGAGGMNADAGMDANMRGGGTTGGTTGDAGAGSTGTGAGTTGGQ